MALRIWLVAAMIACATVAQAATDLEKYQKAVAKVAAPVGAKPKAFCSCNTGDAQQGRVGVIRQLLLAGIVLATCSGDTFDGNGAKNGGFACGVFVPLAK
jgi:hypothetical protein